ncbi:MAG: serine protease [Solirubrobacteraceae bacterium]|jgi:subtilisin family serine protease|nr:serine protease [Solirubrobacteraceae bacterium]
MRRRALIAVTTGLAAASLAGAAPAGAADPATGRLLVSYDRGPAGAHSAAVHAGIARAGARVAGPVLPRIGLVTVRPRPGMSARRTAERLRRQPGVARVEVEHRARLRYVANDPALVQAEPTPGTPPGVTVEWWAAREDLLAAWDITRGSGAKVAVIDTGIDAEHPEFAGRIAGVTDLDADPAHGPATVDEVGHGTHVASLACAIGDNGVGIVGSGFGCSLLVFKSDLSDSSIAKAIVDAVDQGADAINMSFGTDGTTPAATPVVQAVDYAYRHDVTMVAAAADEPVQEQGDPANILQPTGTGANHTLGKGLSVTAAEATDARAPYAGFGTQISIAAYGSFATQGPGPAGILGAFPGNPTSLDAGEPGVRQPCACRTVFNGDARYARIQGTSMATPMVAGVAALMHHLNPDLSAADVIRLLKDTARRPVGTSWTPELGWGILDGGAAVQAARRLDRRPPVSRVSARRGLRAGTVTLQLSGSDRAPTGCKPSGIARYELWRTVAGGRGQRVRTTRETRVHVALRRGVRYGFYVRAVDRAGNREAAPSRPDVRVRLKA